ncbi:hypothetical protein BT96DRAFT_75283 [Gymnopus androsaceus JB14]|uniref:Uncharacterized protein n=1 Tax=Gymnopus androsaceus JB14 TaxID=1447944 RepID=A0A6A4HJW3_9AGAR|nr:hypothetical protein BT96DRAFT_75283 [Gymnopus androsaceus JB14]
MFIMASETENFHQHINVDKLAEILRRLRAEYGPTVRSVDEVEMSRTIADLEDCKVEIHRVKSELHRLEARRLHLEKYKASLCALRSPVRRLPNENFLSIFGFACGTNDLTSKRLETMPALTSSSVCSRWRSLAKSLPDIWSCIHINMNTSFNLPSFPILDLYLASSQQSPLTLTLSEKHGKQLKPHHLAICTTLVGCCTRWKKLRMQRKVWKAFKDPKHSMRFPMLEELAIPNILVYSPLRLDLFQDAPNLRRFSVGMTPFGGPS